MKRLFVWLGVGIALIGVDRVMAGPEPIESKDFKAAPAPVVEPMCRWTGFWIGLHGGYGWGDSGLAEIDDEDSGFHHDVEGFLGGGQAGFNLQIGSWLVLGIESDFAGSAIDEETHLEPSNDEKKTEEVELNTDIDWIATIGGRAGVTFWQNRFLLFFKGGAAFFNFDNRIREFENGELGDVLHDNNDETTGYIGGGLEYALNCHWSLMFEYKHYFLDDDDVTLQGGDSSEESEKHFDRDRNLDSVLFGVNYKF